MGYELASWVPDALKLFIGPLAGAFAGAVTAQAIARRNANIQRWLEELRAANSAVVAVETIVAVAAAMKRQHVFKMKETYDKQAEARDAAQVRGSGTFHVKADLETLPPLRTALPMLEKLVYERVSASRAMLALFSLVVQSVDGFNYALEARNNLVASLKARSPLPPDEIAQIYFGLVTDEGHADQTYPATLEAMADQLDCIILFGCVLAGELSMHAEQVALKRKDFPRAIRSDFRQIAAAGLLPPIGEEEQKIFDALKVVPNLPSNEN